MGERHNKNMRNKNHIMSGDNEYLKRNMVGKEDRECWGREGAVIFNRVVREGLTERADIQREGNSWWRAWQVQRL